MDPSCVPFLPAPVEHVNVGLLAEMRQAGMRNTQGRGIRSLCFADNRQVMGFDTKETGIKCTMMERAENEAIARIVPAARQARTPSIV
jgi:hypothetical protein